AHTWISTPFQLALWEVLLAASIMTILAFVFEGPPQITWNSGLVWAFAYNGVIGTAFAFWAMAVVNSEVPATTASLRALSTPIVGMTISALFLGERIDADLIIAAAMIMVGIAIGTVPSRPKTQFVESAAEAKGP